MKKLFALFLAMIMALSLVACGGDTASEETTTDDTAAEETTTDDTAAAGDVEIAVVLKTLSSEYWGYVKAGCDAAAADLGVKVTVVGPGAESEIEQQVAMIEQQIGAGCDAIIVAPNDAGAAAGEGQAACLRAGRADRSSRLVDPLGSRYPACVRKMQLGLSRRRSAL